MDTHHNLLRYYYQANKSKNPYLTSTFNESISLSNPMNLTTTGKISPHIDFLGSSRICNYLVHGVKESALLDTGMALDAGDLYLQIREHLKDTDRLRWILLSHSHYDHLGGTPFLIKQFPQIKTAAHPQVDEILSKSSAINLIQRLNAEYEALRKMKSDFEFSAFRIDHFLKHNEIIDLGNVSIQVIYTPGHTRGCVSFYILPDRALFGSDVIGAPSPSGYIQTAFLSDYNQYLNSLLELQKLEIEFLCLPHGGVIQGATAAKEFLQKSIDQTISLRERITRYLLDLDYSVDAVTQKIIDEDYQKYQVEQPVQAFRLNTLAMVNTTKRNLFNRP